jgi:hypothetical protein
MKINPTTYPILWFKDRNIEKALVLKPPYQRKPVWTDPQKAYLIDTIIKDYHIPEIYIHRVTNELGKSIYNIVDGQQRVRAILDFIHGDFALSSEYTPEYVDYKFDDLPEPRKVDFYSFILYVREITEASEEDVRNLFKRMNRNVVALNPQELRHATYSGEFIRLMEEISEDDFWAENRIISAKEIKRMIDVQFISELFISMMNGIQDKTKELDSYYEIYETEFTNKIQWRKHFQKTIDLILEILPDLKDHRWKNKSDFYSLFMVLARIPDGHYIPEENIKKLRKDLLLFADKINEASKKTSKGIKFDTVVLNYMNAVTKSTTDKDRRSIRNKILSSIISKYITRKVS